MNKLMQAPLDSDEDESQAAVEPSSVANEVRQLKSAIDSAIAKRERIPQPMFWYLFHSRIKDIRKRRELLRILSGVFGDERS